jgi:16S rRNA processing protein RimM
MMQNSDSVKPTRMNDEGSPRSGEPLFLVVGKIRRPHGIKGELVMEVLTDFPERIQIGRTLYAGDKHQPVKIESLRWHKNYLLIKFHGYDTPESAGIFRNVLIYKPIDHVPQLPEGEYYHYQLMGLRVVDEAGELIGVLQEILITGANDVMLIQSPDNKEVLIPLIDSVLLDVNLEEKTIRVKPPEWD